MNKSSIILNVIVIISLVLIVVYISRNMKRVVYVTTAEVFDGFKMTKEVNSDVKKIEQSKQTILDSIGDHLKKMQAGVIKTDEANFNFVKKEFLTKRNQFAEEITRLKQSSVEKIWKQINQHISEYGKEKGYDLILGANGEGSLMFAEENIDVTKEITEYINAKYDGSN